MATPTSKTRVSPASLLKKSKNISDIRADLNDLISCISTSSDLDVERAKAKLMQKVSGTEKTSAKAVNSRGKSRHGIMRSVEFFRENPLVLAGVTGILFAAHILAQNEECNACETPDSCPKKRCHWCPGKKNGKEDPTSGQCCERHLCC